MAPPQSYIVEEITVTTQPMEVSQLAPVETCLPEFSSIKLHESAESVTVSWADGREAEFSALWLRDNDLSVAFASHRVYASFDDHRTLTGCAITENGRAKVTWNDGHSAYFPTEWLRKFASFTLERLKHVDAPVLRKDSALPTVDYQTVMDSDEGVFLWLKGINDYGAALIRNAPNSKEAINKLIERISVPAYIPLYGYGSDYLVGAEKNEMQKSCPQCFCNMPTPVKVHQDFAYIEDVPGIFYQQVMRRDDGVVGGANTVMDLYEVVNQLKIHEPEAFKTLTEVVVTYAKTAMEHKERPVKTSNQRPIIRLGPDGEVIEIMWSPMYLRTYNLSPADLDRFVQARMKLEEMFERCRAEFEVVVPCMPGDVLVCNNQRMLHARENYDRCDGIRQVYNAYVGYSLFLNRYKTLEARIIGGDPHHVHKRKSVISVHAE